MLNILKYIYNCWIKKSEYTIRSFYAHPGVDAHEHEDLVLFKYTRDYWYTVNNVTTVSWDPVVSAARGIVYNRKTGELLAKPYSKFFNIGQVPETNLENLPKGPFTTTKKLDGCLGVSYKHKGELRIASSGSLKYDISQWATKWANENLKVDQFMDGYTYIFEVLHPDHKIVIDYGDEPNLVLTVVIHTETDREVSYEQLMGCGNMIDCEVTECLFFSSIEEIIEVCEELPFNEEGFVVTFSNGLKIKIKGKEYTRLHYLISDLTPLTFWRAWDIEKQAVPNNLVMNMPDEFKEEIDNLYINVERVHREYAERIIKLYDDIMLKFKDNYTDQAFYPYLKKNHKKENRFLMSYHKKDMPRFWYFVHKQVRPTDNKWPDINNI
jgi:RNA ligase